MLETSTKAAAVHSKKFPKHLTEIYDIDGLLGQGAHATVWKCVHRASGKVRAVKKIDSSELGPREIAHEIALMRLLQHPAVVRCYDVFLEAQFVNIVVDMFAGGDLIDGLNKHKKANGPLPDATLVHLTKQMVSAVAHVHSLQIVHRDVKGENFLCDRRDLVDPKCSVALSDFGTAMRIDIGTGLSQKVGTEVFWAPEIFKGSYDFQVDVWALGVTAFIMSTGYLPLEGEAEICRPDVPGKPSIVVDRASPGCSDFINQCMKKDPAVRLTAAKAAKHAWLNPPAPPRYTIQPKTLPGKIMKWCADLLVDATGAMLVGCIGGFGTCLDLSLGGKKAKDAAAAKGKGDAQKPADKPAAAK